MSNDEVVDMNTDVPAASHAKTAETGLFGDGLVELEIFFYIFNAVRDPIFVKDEGHRWLYLNDAFCQFMGWERDELLGKSDFDFFPKDQAEVFWQKDDETFQSGRETINEERFTDSDGVEHIISTKKSIFVHPASGKKFLVGVIRDFTDIRKTEHHLKQALTQVEQLSNTDDLTGLANRRQLQSISDLQLQIARRSKQEVLLLYIDMDGMKAINDRLGHQQGDKAIIEVAEILKHTLRGSDIIARVGGDEFVVLFTGASVESGKSTILRLMDAVDNRNAERSANYPLSLSIGLSYAEPEEETTLEELIDIADKSMYQHKKTK